MALFKRSYLCLGILFIAGMGLFASMQQNNRAAQ